MPLDEPVWWYDAPPDHVVARLLVPAGWIYGEITLRRMATTPRYRPPIPVICIGNFTAGGTGKTPLAITVRRMLHEMGANPMFLSRGYGGGTTGPHVVDVNVDTAASVGDEPLLLARHAPTVIARDRAEGARTAITAARADCIVMDDGLQNPAIAKDLTIAVVDGTRGLGNGRVIPAGPLRAPFQAQCQHVDLIAVSGTPTKRVQDQIADFKGPRLSAEVIPDGDLSWLRQRPVFAFAGIANPNRFFRLLEANGATLAATRTFADHHFYTVDDARTLMAAAETANAQLVTTEKDIVRFDPRDPEFAGLRKSARALPIQLALSKADQNCLRTALTKAMKTTIKA